VERAICAWLAVGARVRGGVRYAGGTIRRAASPAGALRRRMVDGAAPQEVLAA
jgi:hypothetical protein